MKQQKKRKDLVHRRVLLPKEIADWIDGICAETEESKSLAIVRLLTSLKEMQNNLQKS